MKDQHPEISNVHLHEAPELETWPLADDDHEVTSFMENDQDDRDYELF